MNSTSKKVAFLVHIFYPDLWPELIACVKNLQGVAFDLYVSVVDCAWSQSFQDQILSDMPNAKILISKNHGRDIGGQINLMRAIHFDDYVVWFDILVIHFFGKQKINVTDADDCKVIVLH